MSSPKKDNPHEHVLLDMDTPHNNVMGRFPSELLDGQEDLTLEQKERAFHWMRATVGELRAVEEDRQKALKEWSWALERSLEQKIDALQGTFRSALEKHVAEVEHRIAEQIKGVGTETRSAREKHERFIDRVFNSQKKQNSGFYSNEAISAVSQASESVNSLDFNQEQEIERTSRKAFLHGLRRSLDRSVQAKSDMNDSLDIAFKLPNPPKNTPVGVGVQNLGDSEEQAGKCTTRSSDLIDQNKEKKPDMNAGPLAPSSDTSFALAKALATGAALGSSLRFVEGSSGSSGGLPNHELCGRGPLDLLHTSS